MARTLKPGKRAQQNRESASRIRARRRGENVPYLIEVNRDENGNRIPLHGRFYEYTHHGCRCDLCMDAMRRTKIKYMPAPEIRTAKRFALRESLRDVTRSAKNGPCMDCNKRYPYYVMQFDHLRDKSFGLSSSGIVRHSRQEILNEIKKCELVCSNCHHIRTQRNRTWNFYKATPENYWLQFGQWKPSILAQAA